jgi:hypothetical protein
MRINEIRREAHRLKRRIEKQPRIWKFHGRRVVRAGQWKWGDWSKLPDRYNVLIVYGKSVPEDYLRDYAGLLDKLEDPTYARMVCCTSCVIHQAQGAKKELDRHDRYWQENGGEAAKERWYQEAGEPYTSSFRKDDAIRQVEWRIYNELGEANNRTCEAMNFYHCPYGDAWRQLLQDGHDAHWLWQQIKWYDHHWNRNHTTTPTASEMKWYHYDELSIIDVTDYDDIVRSIDDGRLDKIIDEHTRYMKETKRKISNT